ncbi:hypothetical protein BTH160X_50120 [Brochothrix thermosphacta]|nr:hypothetical protein BTH160X_50120 [Brochothrix thermosphacta]
MRKFGLLLLSAIIGVILINQFLKDQVSLMGELVILMLFGLVISFIFTICFKSN